MDIFETHTHLEDEAFDADREALIESFPAAGIAKLVNVGSSIQTSRKSLELAEKYPNIYAAVGIHPENADEVTEGDYDEIKRLALHEKCVAIGEIGLDYHYEGYDKEKQKEVFLRQLELADELDMSVIIHSRDAASDSFEILKKFAEDRKAAGKELRTVMHCYGYSPELAREYVKLGFFIGVGGVVTFKKARKLIESVEAVPLESIVVETDSPYMSPEPERGQRNNSGKLKYIVEKIADIKGVSADEVASVTFANAERLYGLKNGS